MDILKFIKSWSFDPVSAILTIVITPLLLFLLRILLKHLKEWSRFAIDGILYWISRAIKHTLAATLTLKRYCEIQLKSNSKYLFVPSTQDIALDIDEVYVPLVLEHQGGKQANYTHSDMFSVGDRIRVIGDPGSGKSSLVKRIFRDECLKGIKKPARSRLPIFYELKNLSIPSKISDTDSGLWFYKELRLQVSKTDVYKMEDCFDSYVRTTGLLVLLDGLDEVSSLQYPKVRGAILGLSQYLMQMGGSNIIILTARTQFHQQTKDEYANFLPQVLFVKPFSPSDIYEFLNRWPFQNERFSNITRIFNELGDKPTLRELCSNPLILSMYIAEDQATNHSIVSETRTEFYSKVTEELLVRRRLRQTGPTIARTKLKEQRERILGSLAYEHLCDLEQPANSLSWQRAIVTVGEIVGCNHEEAEKVFREMSKETGLFTEERIGESFRFIHLTFCEFLAATEAIQGRKNGLNNLIKSHKEFLSTPKPHLHSRLVEVIPFACGLLHRINRNEILSDLMKIDDPQLHARVFLETKQYDHPSWQAFVKAEHNRLMSAPEDLWNTEWFRSLHLFNVVTKDAEACAVHIPSTKIVNLDVFYQNLVSKQRRSLSTLFASYASQDAAAAFRFAEVCRLDMAIKFPEVIVKNCDQAPFFALVRQRILQEVNRVGLWASLLSEAALRSRVVASWMKSIPVVNEWNILLDEVPKSRRWIGTTLIRDNFYLQILTIATGPKGIYNQQLRMLNLIKNVPPPNSFKMSSKFFIFIMPLIGIFAVILILNALQPKIDSSPLITLLVALLTFPFVLFMYFLLFRHMSLRINYLNLLYGYNRYNSGIWGKFKDQVLDFVMGRRFMESVNRVLELRLKGYSDEHSSSMDYS